MYLESDAPVPTLVDRPIDSELTSILSTLGELVKLDDTDAILKRAVEIGRVEIGLSHVGIFLYDQARRRMVGTWGTDLEGRTTDEHDIEYEIGPNDLEVFRRAADEGAYFTAVENAPIVQHLPGETRLVARGWGCCTPIRSARGPLGMMYNDTGPGDSPFDESKQTRAAVLCSLVGTVLDLGAKPPGSRPLRRACRRERPSS